MSDEQEWWRGSVFYQVYPMSFADSNGDGVGDLRGITERLEYLKWLGVDAVWLSPFYRSPMIDFGYDVSDYYDVDPTFGSLQDFEALIDRAHNFGLRIIIDFVPNHTSDQHSWFVEARSSMHSPKRDWYIWAAADPTGGPPNNWLSCFEGVGAAWTLDQTTGQYYLHSYTASQPDLNWWNVEVREEMQHVMRFWLDRNVDGFRIDVPHRLIKDRQLTNNPAEVEHARRAFGRPTPPFRNMNQPEVHDVLRIFRRLLDSYSKRVTVGEVGVTDPEVLASYYGRKDELHLAFTFAFWQQEWSACGFSGVIEEIERVFPAGAWPAYALSNHDISRAASRYGIEQMRLAALMLLTLRGTPFLYYGEEIGMLDSPVDSSLRLDPDGRDGARAPMRWEGGTDSVESGTADSSSLLMLYHDLLFVRRDSPALKFGSYSCIVSNEALFAYTRQLGGERVLVALNFSNQEISCDTESSGGTVLVSSCGASRKRFEGRALLLAPNEGVVARLD